MNFKLGILQTILIVAVVLVGIFGPMITLGLVNGDMHCDFMGSSSGMCPMTLAYHLDHWHEFFSAIIWQLVFALIVFGTVVYSLVANKYLNIQAVKTEQLFFKLHNFLVLLFSQGILNPRIA